MGFLRRIWNRDDASVPAACTALDIGTEFAKALVFEIDETGHGTVRGVGRKRQGLAHMQSGTVADIAAVVDNCAVALQEAEEMAGFRPTQVVIGIAGELVKGFAKGLRGTFPSGVIAVGMEADEPQLFVSVSDDLVARGIAAGPLVQQAVTRIDGRGGGRPEMAQGKGTRRDGLPEALAAIRSALAAES